MSEQQTSDETDEYTWRITNRGGSIKIEVGPELSDAPEQAVMYALARALSKLSVTLAGSSFEEDADA